MILSFIIIRLFSILLLPVLLFLGIFLSKAQNYDQEKARPFECGFSPKGNARLPFSIRFFLIALIFLVFDVELVLLFPCLLTFIRGRKFFVRGGILLFILILLIGVFHEWNQGRLDWAN